ncbi:uncharacterized protein LOC114519462 [Dendronephthya gigantea]|uniref:uncharacterized protein LOC114519462 n=1 Tax=Dendronephthya gigantea TaxID=151771 RepID=UPI0010698A57|nr:uncharacterized protein LOC114519462 [Dendronephthya gigantea]
MGNEASSEVNSNEEDIGIALFEKVRSFHEENAAKITGMLLEMPADDLKNIFSDDSKLMSQIYEAIKVLEKETEKDKRELLGDALYSEVEAVYSEHDIAEKITGMLLELRLEDIERLMQNKNDLLVKIREAFEALQRHKNTALHASETTDEPLTKAEMGDKIFDRIQQWYPDDEMAAKLTGMLLEINSDEIKKLTQEDKLLKSKVDEAYHAMNRDVYQ